VLPTFSLSNNERAGLGYLSSPFSTPENAIGEWVMRTLMALAVMVCLVAGTAGPSAMGHAQVNASIPRPEYPRPDFQRDACSI
jgi:hypothetical protein